MLEAQGLSFSIAGFSLLRDIDLRVEPGKVTAGKVTKSQIKEIAETKMADLNANDVDQAMKIIEGSARSMGLDVVELSLIHI